MADIKISLAAARVNAGMKQQDVAEELHISKSTLVSWEKGHSVPSFNMVQKMSEMYNIPMDNIFLPSTAT